MSARQSYEVTLALRLVIERGWGVSAAAREHGIAVSSLRRALRRAGIPPFSPPRRAQNRSN